MIVIVPWDPGLEGLKIVGDDDFDNCIDNCIDKHLTDSFLLMQDALSPRPENSVNILKLFSN